MKSMFKKVLVIFFILGLFVEENVHADTSTNNEIIKNQNSMMEKYLELENKYSELKEKWADEKIELENKKRDVDSTLLKIVVIVVALNAAGFFWIKKYIKDKVAEIADKNIKNEVKKVVENYESEVKIRNSKNICVIFHEDKDNETIKEVLKPFEKVKYVKINEYKKLNKNEIDAIIFNDINNNMDIEQAEKIVESNNNSRLVYLGFKYGKFNVNSSNMSYANSRITLYGNLMNALKYQDEVLSDK